MNQLPYFTKSIAAISACVFSLALNGSAEDAVDAREKPTVLLEGVKKRELASQLAMKETEMQRLNEDLQKRKSEQATLQQTMDSITGAVADSADVLEQYLARKKYLVRALELTGQRIDAERLKVDGLKALGDAQAKAREHVAKQYEATSIRANIEGANLRILSQKQTPPEGEALPKDAAAKLLSEIEELKKKLERSERTVATAAKLARDAMSSATEKLLQAESAAAKAKKTAAEWNLNEDADPVAERVGPDATTDLPTEAPSAQKQK